MLARLLHLARSRGGESRCPQVPYLRPYYAGYSPPGIKLKGRPLAGLVVRVLRGRGPPAPFSRGLLTNLWTFFVARKPRAHTLVRPADEQHP